MKIIGVDDGAFRPIHGAKQLALLVAVLFDDARISDVRLGQIEVDGRNANDVLSSLLSGVEHDAVLLSGISFGGFNVVDIAALSKTLRKAVIIIAGDRPDNEAVRKALRGHFLDWKDRWRIIRSAGPIHSVKIRDEPALYFEVQGASPSFAKKLILSTARVSRLPEPIRVARILARGLSALS